MHWYYEERGQQVGPLSDEDFQKAIRAGRISDATLVWNETLSDWMPYGLLNARPPAVPGEGPGTPMQTCSQCNRPYAQQDLIRYGGLSICASCKTTFFQRLKEEGRVAAIWRDGKQLVAARDTVLPDRCVKCNAPARGHRMTKKFYWHPPAFYLLICAGILIYAIVALIVRKNSILHLGICPEHRAKRKRSIAITWSLVGLACVSIVAGAVTETGEIAFIGALFILGALIYGIVSTQLVSPTRIDPQGVVWLKGVPPTYLEGLPDYRPL